MGNFRPSSNRGNNRGYGDRDFKRPEMHRAVCDECGNDCEVPFNPTGDKPVYCSDCFRTKSGSDSRRSGGRDSRRFGSGDRQMYKAVCDKCGKDCEVPFKPTKDKPIYCSSCFDKGDRGKGSEQSNKQLEAINDKLDMILKMLTSKVSIKTSEKPKVAKKLVIVKPKVKKVTVLKKVKATKKK